MGLKTTIQNAVTTAKASTLDLWVSIDYKSYEVPVYNATTGVVTDTKVTTTLKGLVDTYGSNQVNGNAVQETDLKIIINQAELKSWQTAQLLTPDTNDVVTYSNKDWNVIDIKQDPANSLWELQLRVSN